MQDGPKWMEETAFAVITDKCINVDDDFCCVGREMVEPATGPEDEHDFIVQLKREGANWNDLGCILTEFGDKYLVVSDLWSPGLLAEWNARQQDPERGVRQGDLVCAVNGVDIPSVMQGVIQASRRKGDILFLHVRKGPKMKQLPSKSIRASPPGSLPASSPVGRHWKQVTGLPWDKTSDI